MSTSPAPDDNILTVGELTRRVKESLETEFPSLWVRGEISGFKRADSGHLYFALKEGRDALIDCVMWRASAGRLGFEPRDGAEVEAFGGITVYEPRGRYQLVARELRPAGLGALLLALEELKRRLQAEGLFDAARKRPLPKYPARIGLVTSPVGAAVRDMVKVLGTRWPGVGIVLAPVRVQGAGAADEIAAAIARFNRLAGVDVLIVGRGGGSLEDLWAFNEEPVVRAIAASRIPVISAVGHEVDWTLADLVADVRAATPSNAAELAVRDRREVARHLGVLREHARRAIVESIETRRRRLRTLVDQYGFRRQRDALGPLRQRIDELGERILNATQSALRDARRRLEAAAQRYGLREWPRELRGRREHIDGTRARLNEAMVRAVEGRRGRLDGYGHRLRALSPRMVLERGFCIARRPDGSLVRAAMSLAAGEVLSLEFARGEADARVESVRPRGTHGSEEERAGG
jgi:exodeoxyribonuclease VII large subunit